MSEPDVAEYLEELVRPVDVVNLGSMVTGRVWMGGSVTTHSCIQLIQISTYTRSNAITRPGRSNLRDRPVLAAVTSRPRGIASRQVVRSSTDQCLGCEQCIETMQYTHTRMRPIDMQLITMINIMQTVEDTTDLPLPPHPNSIHCGVSPP